MEQIRETLKIVVVGHVDHGKSTLIGRLLYDTKSLPEGAIERVKRISKEKGKPFEYAYLLDAFEEEQRQGITIDTTQLQFQTEKRDYVIIDAPGHKEFLKNMISGAANAEAALLLVDANEGVQEQSRRHGYILSLLGIQKVYVVVNKMDLVDYSQARFNQVKSEMEEFLNHLGVYPQKYIPISAFLGENMTKPSDKMSWDQSGPILDAMDAFEKDTDLIAKPLRFPIQDVYKFDDRRIIVGRIETGTLRAGDEILISPGNKTTCVKSIEVWQKKDETDHVTAGMSVGITVEDEFFNKRGEFITHKADAPYTGNQFRANLFWMGKAPLVKHKQYKLKLTTQEVECEVQAIHKVIDATTLDAYENAEQIKTNDVAEVTIRCKSKISFDLFRNNQHTGRFVLVDGYDVSGGGIVSGLEASARVNSTFIKEELELPARCFNEYYYIIPDGVIRKIEKEPELFTPGDDVPVTGDTYRFPENFDIVDLHHQSIVLVRQSKLYDLIYLENYEFNQLPVFNQKGFYININSNEDWNQYQSEYRAIEIDDSEKFTAFLNRWTDFMKYRNIKYKQFESAGNIDYQI